MHFILEHKGLVGSKVFCKGEKNNNQDFFFSRNAGRVKIPSSFSSSPIFGVGWCANEEERATVKLETFYFQAFHHFKKKNPFLEWDEVVFLFIAKNARKKNYFAIPTSSQLH